MTDAIGIYLVLVNNPILLIITVMVSGLIVAARS